MKTYRLFLFLLLFSWIFSLENTASAAEHKISWQYNKSVKDPSRGSLDLTVDGGDYPIILKAEGPYQSLQPSEFSSYGIPKEALLAAFSWYAGSGDVVYVVQKKDRLEVYRREMDESETGHLPVKKIYTVYLK